jgi:hypothetical protein
MAHKQRQKSLCGSEIYKLWKKLSISSLRFGAAVVVDMLLNWVRKRKGSEDVKICESWKVEEKF